MGGRSCLGLKSFRYCNTTSNREDFELRNYFLVPAAAFERWRTTSKSMTPAATDTLSERTGPEVGSETRKSQRLRVSSYRPSPSLPTTIPTESLRSTLV